jgi:hypothetical protein
MFWLASGDFITRQIPSIISGLRNNTLALLQLA